MASSGEARASLILSLILLLSACATRHEVAEDYQKLVLNNPAPTSGRTVVFFLVDGLQESTLEQELIRGTLPNIQKFFLEGKTTYHRARSTFPSLTFPAIASLLSEGPVGQHNVSSNKLLRNDRLTDFENYEHYPELNRMMAGHNVFARLSSKGLRTVSLDYAFHTGASVHTTTQDLNAGFSLLGHDYAYVDSKIIESLDLLLKGSPVNKWPDFIFVHLTGLDFISHEDGPESRSVSRYLRSLDGQLGAIFKTLGKAERGGQRVVGMLSSDHGFDKKPDRILQLSEKVHKRDPRIEMIDEGRVMGLNFPRAWPAGQAGAFVEELLLLPEVDFIALSTGSDFQIRAREPPTYPFLRENLAHYFNSNTHPDAVVVAKPGVAFNRLYRGYHGGPTEREVLVPLLLHNAELPATGSIPTLWELLKFL